MKRISILPFLLLIFISNCLSWNSVKVNQQIQPLNKKSGQVYLVNSFNYYMDKKPFVVQNGGFYIYQAPDIFEEVLSVGSWNRIEKNLTNLNYSVKRYKHLNIKDDANVSIKDYLLQSYQYKSKGENSKIIDRTLKNCELVVKKSSETGNAFDKFTGEGCSQSLRDGVQDIVRNYFFQAINKDEGTLIESIDSLNHCDYIVSAIKTTQEKSEIGVINNFLNFVTIGIIPAYQSASKSYEISIKVKDSNSKSSINIDYRWTDMFSTIFLPTLGLITAPIYYYPLQVKELGYSDEVIDSITIFFAGK